jgi:hypothetical protein
MVFNGRIPFVDAGTKQLSCRGAILEPTSERHTPVHFIEFDLAQLSTQNSHFRLVVDNSGDTSSRSRSEGRGAGDAKDSESKSELHFGI